MTQPRPLRLFISYAHQDDAYRQELETCLTPLKRHGLLEIWSDRAIEAGREWWPEIHRNLETADLILLLISPDFLASDFCCETELKRAMERHDAGETQVIPVLLRPCDWKNEVFGKLQGLPNNVTPISQWRNRDKAYTQIAQVIRCTAETMRRPGSASASDAIDAESGGPGSLWRTPRGAQETVVTSPEELPEPSDKTWSSRDNAALRQAAPGRGPLASQTSWVILGGIGGTMSIWVIFALLFPNDKLTSNDTIFVFTVWIALIVSLQYAFRTLCLWLQHVCKIAVIFSRSAKAIRKIKRPDQKI